MRELALFAGAGGGMLASHLLGWSPVCAVEISPYCRRVLCARQLDGILRPFPIWDDVRTFDARPWFGAVDVVSGGFPCQPFSGAARGRNVAPDLWPHMLRVVRECAPRHVFAENVRKCPIERAAIDLGRLGYRCAAVRMSAASVGAPHRRDRYWLRADADGNGESVHPEHAQTPVLRSLAGRNWSPGSLRGVRVANGVAYRVDRTRAAGNGQVPAVAASAWRLLSAALR